MIHLNMTLLYVLLAQQAIDQLNYSQNVLHKKSSRHRRAVVRSRKYYDERDYC